MIKVTNRQEDGDFTLITVDGERGRAGTLRVPNKRELPLTSVLEGKASNQGFKASVQYETENFSTILLEKSGLVYGNLHLSHEEANNVLDRMRD
jgi:hypothetical protein